MSSTHDRLPRREALKNSSTVRDILSRWRGFVTKCSSLGGCAQRRSSRVVRIAPRRGALVTTIPLERTSRPTIHVGAHDDGVVADAFCINRNRRSPSVFDPVVQHEVLVGLRRVVGYSRGSRRYSFVSSSTARWRRSRRPAPAFPPAGRRKTSKTNSSPRRSRASCSPGSRSRSRK